MHKTEAQHQLFSIATFRIYSSENDHFIDEENHKYFPRGVFTLLLLLVDYDNHAFT